MATTSPFVWSAHEAQLRSGRTRVKIAAWRTCVWAASLIDSARARGGRARAVPSDLTGVLWAVGAVTREHDHAAPRRDRTLDGSWYGRRIRPPGRSV
jgi:hypothetical protein